MFFLHDINIATFLKVTLSGNLSSVSIKILALPNFLMPVISLVFANVYLAYNRQPSNIFFLHVNISSKISHQSFCH